MELLLTALGSTVGFSALFILIFLCTDGRVIPGRTDLNRQGTTTVITTKQFNTSNLQKLDDTNPNKPHNLKFADESGDAPTPRDAMVLGGSAFKSNVNRTFRGRKNLFNWVGNTLTMRKKKRLENTESPEYLSGSLLKTHASEEMEKEKEDLPTNRSTKGVHDLTASDLYNSKAGISVYTRNVDSRQVEFSGTTFRGDSNVDMGIFSREMSNGRSELSKERAPEPKSTMQEKQMKLPKISSKPKISRSAKPIVSSKPKPSPGVSLGDVEDMLMPTPGMARKQKEQYLVSMSRVGDEFDDVDELV